MPYNGSGSFVPPGSSFPYTASTLIESAKVNAVINDIATGLSTAVTKDGQTAATANLPMGGFWHTGVGNASTRDNYAAAGQVQDGTLNWVTAGGTADALTATYVPAITALVDGQLCCVRAGAANTTTTPTFAPNAITARTIVKQGGQALAVGDIRAANHDLILRYRLAATVWELLNPALGTMASQSASAAAITGGTVTGITDLVVADGGTGASTFTDGGVLIGNGTGAVQVTTAGTSGQVLTSNGAGVDPTFQNISTPSAASQAEQETGSSTTVFASPGRQHFHQSAAKAWVNFNGTGTPAIRVSYNVSSITDNAVGDWTINFTTAFSTADYCPVGMASDPSTGGSGYAVAIKGATAPTASALRVLTGVSNGAAIDVPYACVAVFGDQ